MYYSTEEVSESMNSALEGEDFEPLKRAELEFDRGEIEKQIEVKLAEKDDEDVEDDEVYMVFAVKLFDPSSGNHQVTLSTKDRCIV